MTACVTEVRVEECELSWLPVNQCAHCLGHKSDWETKAKVKVDG